MSAKSASCETASNCSASAALGTRSVLVTTATTVARSAAISAGDEPVALADRLVGRQAQADHVDLAPHLADQVVEALAEQRARAVQAGRVDQDELRVGPVQHRADHVPGGLRPVGGDGDLLTDDRVGQGRLAGVGSADKAREPGPIGTHVSEPYRRVPISITAAFTRSCPVVAQRDLPPGRVKV